MKAFEHESWHLESFRRWQSGHRSDQQKCHYSQNICKGRTHVLLLVLMLNILMKTQEKGEISDRFKLYLVQHSFGYIMLKTIRSQAKGNVLRFHLYRRFSKKGQLSGQKKSGSKIHIFRDDGTISNMKLDGYCDPLIYIYNI